MSRYTVKMDAAFCTSALQRVGITVDAEDPEEPRAAMIDVVYGYDQPMMAYFMDFWFDTYQAVEVHYGQPVSWGHQLRMGRFIELIEKLDLADLLEAVCYDLPL